MTTTFKGHRTGFNPTGSNTCAPNELGPSNTTYSGRGALPAGKMKRHAGATADISSGNRRLAKTKHGDGGGSGTTIRGTNAFSKKGR